MKKLLYCAAALAMVLFSGSCQRESLEPVTTGGVTYTITLPETIQTKGSSGYEEYDLHYEVYKTADANALAKASLLFEKTVQMTGDRTTVSLDLLNDQDYTVLFWANKQGTDYFDLTDLRKVGVKQATANNDDRDAFCGMDQMIAHDGAQSKTVELTRPFAQVNIATLVPTVETIGYDVTPTHSYVRVSSIPVTFNVFTGLAEGTTTSVDFSTADEPATIPAGGIAVNNTEYKKVAMNYILVPESVVDVYYEITTVNGVVKNTISNVPVKKNYRTNIIGNLLTSNATYTVVLLPGFEENAYVGPEFVQEPMYNAETKTYTVTNKYELLWVADQVNSQKKDFYGETVQIAADIDLENKPWTPIGISTSVCFRGMFEGVALTKSENTYPTISNLYIENGNCSGLFAVLCNGGRARNLNFKHARISGERQLGVLAGQIYSSAENITVEDAVITAVPVFDGSVYDNGDKVGGIAGLVGQEATFTGCTVKNSLFKAYRDMGGIVGSTQNDYVSTFIGNKVENLTFVVSGIYTPYMDNDEPGYYAPIRGGRRGANDVFENNEGNDISLHSVAEEESEGAAYDETSKVYYVTAPEGLSVALSGAGAAGAGDHTIRLSSDLDMTGIDWTPINVDGYNGADIVTVEGNGATIKGLDAALFAGGFAGGSGIVIKDLTIEGAYMIADNTQGYGAFVNCADSMDEITLINCHLKNSTIITPNDGADESRIGGLVGWTAGYNVESDGPVDSYITIKNCSVTGCTLKGAGSIGGICGHAGANTATFTTIENCTVTGNTLVSTDNGSWRVGAIVGTANNGQCVINNVNVSGNTISQVGKTPEIWQSELYGRFVPSGTGTLTIDGVAVSAANPVLVDGYTALYSIDGNYYVYNKKGLEELNLFFKNNCYNNSTWMRSYNIAADIDATGLTWTSVYIVVGDNNNDGFVFEGNNHTISNLTITGGAMFAGTANGSYSDVPMIFRNLVIDNADVTAGAHFNGVFWGSVYGDTAFENVVVKNTEISGNCNVGAFVGGTTIEDGRPIKVTFTNCSVENSSLEALATSSPDPTGASGFIGRAYGKTSIEFIGTNTIDEATTLTNNNGLVGGKVYGYTTWTEGGFAGTGVCDTFTDWAGVSIAAKVGTTIYNTIEEAIEAAQVGDEIKLVDDVTPAETIVLPDGVTLNGNGKQINGTLKAGGDVAFAGHTKVTAFSADSDNEITIGQGACLEVNGTGRGTFGYGNTFNITGNITDAKTADKASIQPSFIIPAGISITGGKDFTLNVTNAYVQIGNTSSKNSVANGTFTLNIENSIAEFTNQFTIAEPTGGMTPTFKLNIKNSVVTTAAKLNISAKNTEVKIDNSAVTLGTYFRNSGTLELTNGSVLTGATIQFGENGGNDGKTIVDASTLTINASSSAHALDGKGTGRIELKNGAVVNLDYYKDLDIINDGTGTLNTKQ